MSEPETAARFLTRLDVDVAAVARLLPDVDLRRIRVRNGPRWLLRGYSGIALPWGIHLRPGLRASEVLPTLLHELVHMEQWRQIGVVRFSFRYVGEYLRGRLRRLGHQQAYLAIGAEAEARRATVILLAAVSGADPVA